jgi:hypothetical protein
MDNSEENTEPQFSHVLQKMGILKNFSIAKTLSIRELEKIKKVAREQARTDEEYTQLIQKRMAQFSNMHDKNNLVPGIIYLNDIIPEVRDELVKTSRHFSEKIKDKRLTPMEMAFIIREMIAELRLTREDFEKLDRGKTDDDDLDE